MVGAPFDFMTGDGGAAYGGIRTVSRDQSDLIFHIFSADSLYFFCANSEYVIDQGQTAELALAPILHDSSRCCVRTIRPIEGEDGGLLFINPKNRGISEFRFHFERASYEGHVFSTHFGSLTSCANRAVLWKGDVNFATNILFFLTACSELFAVTVKLGEKIAACCWVENDGEFLDLAVVDNTVYVLFCSATDSLQVGYFDSYNYLDNGEKFLPSSSEDRTALNILAEAWLAEAPIDGKTLPHHVDRLLRLSERFGIIPDSYARAVLSLVDSSDPAACVLGSSIVDSILSHRPEVAAKTFGQDALLRSQLIHGQVATGLSPEQAVKSADNFMKPENSAKRLDVAARLKSAKDKDADFYGKVVRADVYGPGGVAEFQKIVDALFLESGGNRRKALAVADADI